MPPTRELGRKNCTLLHTLAANVRLSVFRPTRAVRLGLKKFALLESLVARGLSPQRYWTDDARLCGRRGKRASQSEERDAVCGSERGESWRPCIVLDLVAIDTFIPASRRYVMRRPGRHCPNVLNGIAQTACWLLVWCRLPTMCKRDRSAILGETTCSEWGDLGVVRVLARNLLYGCQSTIARICRTVGEHTDPSRCLPGSSTPERARAAPGQDGRGTGRFLSASGKHALARGPARE